MKERKFALNSADEPVPFLELRGIERSYPNGTEALKGIDLAISEGEAIAIVGRSGSGKSTLLNILGLLDTPTAGEMVIDGKAVDTSNDKARSAWRSSELGFVFQRAHLINNLTVRENVLLGLAYSPQGAEDSAEVAEQALKEVGLSHRIDAPARTLSGGEMQRVAIARTLARPARLWLADEPTGNLDSAQSAEIISLLKQRAREHGATLIVVTHEPEIAEQLDRIVTLVDGEIVDDSGKQPLQPEQIEAFRPRRSRDKKAARKQRGKTLRFVAQGISSNPSRARSGIIAAAVAVALTVVALGLAQSASSQVTAMFDAQRASQVTAEVITEDPEPRWPVQTDQVENFAGVVGAEYWQERSDVPIANGEIETTTASVMTVTATPGAITESHIRWAKAADEEISDESVIIGQALANRLGLKLIDLMPEIEVQGMPVRVTGIIESDRSPAAAGAVFVTSDLSDKLGDSTSGTLFIKTMPGAARNVAKSLPVLINPYGEARVNIAPVLQPDSYRGALQDSVAISLLVLAVVASLAGLGAVILVNVLSVTARVPEFGVRRAFGARRKNIVTLVIGECVMLGFVGAVVGLAIGFAAIMTVTMVAKWQPVFDPKLLIVPLAGALLFGTMGSIPPAIAAGRIEPADAVRA